MASIEDIKNQIKLSYLSGLADVPVILGPPGVGKTAGVRQAAEELGIGYKETTAYAFSPDQILGIPFVPIVLEQGGAAARDPAMRYATPSMLPNEEVDGPKGIMLLDEIASCIPMQQHAWGNLIYARRGLAWEMPRGWMFVCTGNRKQDKTGAHDLSPMFTGRVTEYEVEASTEAWLAYARRAGINPFVVRFIERNPMKLMTYQPGMTGKYGSPRTWEIASEKLRWLEPPYNAPIEQVLLGIQGNIGAGLAHELGAFIKEAAAIPSLDDMLAGRVDYTMIKRIDAWPAMNSQLHEFINSSPPDELPSRVEAVLDVLTAPGYKPDFRSSFLQRAMTDQNQPPLVRSTFIKAASARGGISALTMSKAADEAREAIKRKKKP